MLVCYSGLPGSGKTAHAARDVRYALTGRVPRPVIANFELGPNAPIPDDRRKWFHYIPNEEMSTARILGIVQEYWDSPECPHGAVREDEVLLIIDEAQIGYNSRTFMAKDRMDFLTFLSQSRHYGVKVILISQKITMIDKQFRDLVSLDYEHRRLRRIHWIMSPVEWFMEGCVTLVVKRMYQDHERMGTDIFCYGKKDFDMYDSYNYIRQKAEIPKSAPNIG